MKSWFSVSIMLPRSSRAIYATYGKARVKAGKDKIPRRTPATHGKPMQPQGKNQDKDRPQNIRWQRKRPKRQKHRRNILPRPLPAAATTPSTVPIPTAMTNAVAPSVIVIGSVWVKISATLRFLILRGIPQIALQKIADVA